MMEISATTKNISSNYSEVNGIKMYYEIYGKGRPLVFLFMVAALLFRQLSEE